MEMIEKMHWVGGWSSSPSDFKLYPLNLQDQTLRIILKINMYGEKLRIRLSNKFGKEDIHINKATIGLYHFDQNGFVTNLKELTFKGNSSLVIRRGETIYSDELDFTISTFDHLAINLYFLERTTITTANSTGAKCYISLNGDKTKALDLKEFFGDEYNKAEDYVTYNIPLITGVDVYTTVDNNAIVTFGDSITAGMWPDFLAQRLNRLGIKHLSILRQGIGGNRILHDSTSQQFEGLFGIAGIKRFEEDAIKQSGVKYIIVLEGINDIMHPGSITPLSETVSAEQLIDGLKFYADMAHKNGIKIFAGTIMPYGCENPDDTNEQKRQKVNEWIRTSNYFDGFIDFDKALRNPDNPLKLLEKYDCGDKLHPSEEGYKAMAEAIDIKLFE